VSWDLLVAVHDRPSAAPLERAFTIGEPVNVELEDLPDELAGAVLAPRFLVEISVPAGARAADRARAVKLAKQLAVQGRGAVYDPQEDALLWPKRRPRVRTPAATEARIRVVELTWYVAGHECLPDALLEVLRAACPEAVPRRYGDYEPLQHKLEPGGEPAFVDFWGTIAAKELGSSLDWKAQPPCFSGAVSFPDRRTAYPSGEPVGIPGTRRCTKISLDFDGRALHGDPRWCEAVVALLPLMARRLGAFYAAGHVQRNVIVKRSLWYDGDSETVPMPFSWFAGLPPAPTWLAWFGPAYVPHVAAALAGRAEPTADGALYFRAGAEPMDADQLEGCFPPLPAALAFRTRDDPPEGEPRVIAADHIPLPE
jgi:hypothetical protein